MYVEWITHLQDGGLRSCREKCDERKGKCHMIKSGSVIFTAWWWPRIGELRSFLYYQHGESETCFQIWWDILFTDILLTFRFFLVSLAVVYESHICIVRFVPERSQGCRTTAWFASNLQTTRMFVYLLAVFLSLQFISADQSKNTSQPHIIFIVADDLVSIPPTREEKWKEVLLNPFKLS